jgi:hypothetical protein
VTTTAAAAGAGGGAAGEVLGALVPSQTPARVAMIQIAAFCRLRRRAGPGADIIVLMNTTMCRIHETAGAGP